MLLRQRYPHIDIIGDNYPPPSYRLFLAKVINLTKFSLIACIWLDINPFRYFQYATPNTWTWLSTRKFYGSLLIFFITNSIEGQLISTGAFEIYLNGKWIILIIIKVSSNNIYLFCITDKPIWSKLEKNYVPPANQLLAMIDRHLKSPRELN